jgi:biopolymer transport protein ExbD
MPTVHQTAGASGGRRARGARVSTTLSEINVVPLVDVMLVLLVIFMVAAPMMTQGLAVNLPQARRASPVTAQPLYVTIPADFGSSRVVQLGNDEIRVDLLHERVRQAMLTRTEKSLFLRTDASVTAQQIMTVIDQLRQAGVEKIGFATRPVDRRQAP